MVKLRKTALLAYSLVALAGCDTFFVIDAVVIDEVTGNPISDATATLVLDKGVSEPDQQTTSGENGAIYLIMNEPNTAWASLTVEKPGYQTWSTQFRGKHHFPFVVRLIPD